MIGVGGRPGLGNHDAVGEDLEDDLAPGVLVLPVRHGVDQRLAQRVDRVLVEPHAVEPNDAHRVSGVAIDEGDRALDGERHRSADVLVVARIAVWLGAPIGVGQDAALGKDRRGVLASSTIPAAVA